MTECYSTEQILSAWSVSWVLRFQHDRVHITRTVRVESFASEMQPKDNREHKGRIIVYRRRFEKILACKKDSLRDQIIIELPTLQAFRTGEIATLRAEDFDFENGDIQILDSKKHRYSWMPLNYTVGKHGEQYLQETGKKGRDFVIDPLPDAPRRGRKPGSKTRGEGLSEQQILYLWAKYSKLAGLPEPLTPRDGRAYFAAVQYFVLKKTAFFVQTAMRHDYFETTIHYLERIVDYEDFKTEFHRGEEPFFSLSTVCEASCPYYQHFLACSESLKLLEKTTK